MTQSSYNTTIADRASSISALRDRIAAGETKAASLTEEYLDRIDAVNPEINAYLSVYRNHALERAAAIDAAAGRGDALPPLAGIPMGIKDVLVVEGMAATAGSKILGGYRPPYTATAVERLQDAGAVLLGKLNCDEFAMGSSNENSAYGPVRNPLRSRSRPRWLQRRLGRGRCRRDGRRHAGHGYRRLHPPARVLLRSRRPVADLRPRLALWPDRLRFFARSRRPVQPHVCDDAATAARRHRRPRSAWTRPPPTVPVPDYRGQCASRSEA